VGHAGEAVALDFGRALPVQVVDDEEIEVAIGVVVEKRGARAPAAAGDARLRRHVGEVAAAVAFEQDVAAVVGDVEIDASVVVEVARGDAHAVAAGVGAAAGRDIVERAVAAIAIEAVAVGLVARREQVAALHQVEIEIAVAVHVEQRGAAAHDLGQVELLLVARAVGEADAALLGDVLEPGTTGRRRRRRFLRGSMNRGERDHRSAGLQACPCARGSPEGLRYGRLHRLMPRSCSAACLTSGDAGSSCAACCSAADARSHCPVAIVALATPTQASTRVGSRRVARPKLSSAPAGLRRFISTIPSQTLARTLRGSNRKAVRNAAAAAASSPARHSTSPLASCARPRVGLSASARSASARALSSWLRLTYADARLTCASNRSGSLATTCSSIAIPSSTRPAATYTSPR